MVSKKSDNSILHLQTLGFSDDEIEVYLYLLEQGTKTPLQVSRALKLPRTRVYRITESLMSKDVISEQIDNRGSQFVASHPDNLQSMVSMEKAKIEEKEAILGVLIPDLSSRMSSLQESSHVRFYRGLVGLKQVTWNSLKAEGELLTYEVGHLDYFISQKKQSEDFRQRFVEKEIMIRNLLNETQMDGFTDVHAMVDTYWEARYIPPSVLTIKADILIYNNVYAMYRFQDNDIFCIEVYNQELVDMQRQIYEVLWSIGKPYEVLDKRGKIMLRND